MGRDERDVLVVGLEIGLVRGRRLRLLAARGPAAAVARALLPHRDTAEGGCGRRPGSEPSGASERVRATRAAERAAAARQRLLPTPRDSG